MVYLINHQTCSDTCPLAGAHARIFVLKFSRNWNCRWTKGHRNRQRFSGIQRDVPVRYTAEV
jgi:hypothetical protein